MEKGSHTERSHRLLILWLDLQRAFKNTGEFGLAPWNSKDPRVAVLWEKITHPQNDHALEEWLIQSGSGEPERWAQQALLACRKRMKRD